MKAIAIDNRISNNLNNFLICNHNLPTPYLAIDLDLIAKNYRDLQSQLPDARIYYAVKANPAPEILQLLVGLGSRFDTASLPEIEQCLQAGAAPEHLCFGNTIKKSQDIATAYRLGVRLFAFDSIQELEKIAIHAPKSQVFCRIHMECAGAKWPLSRKFGCELDMVVDLLVYSRSLDLQPYGLSFHVGSQQLDMHQWDNAIATTAGLFDRLARVGVQLEMVNLGGGFPARYRSTIPSIYEYTQVIDNALTKYFNNNRPNIMLEPGRSLVADAGLINTEVVLISHKSYTEERRWVFLDIGKFGGLAETMDETIEYRVKTPWDGTPTASVILAGPTCDSVDILYDRADYQLPLNLAIGDRIQILSTGAYTSTYASVGFNGFPPLAVYCI
jgi:ornithine decarboxylase